MFMETVLLMPKVSESQTYEYAKTILSLMTREAHPNGMVWYGIRHEMDCI